MNESETTRLIEDYCIHRIRRESIELPSYQHVSREPYAPVAARMREIGEEIERTNPEFFSGCCEELNISATTAYAKFKDLADELFKDQENGSRGVTWGRIAALIAFSGRLSVHCASNNLEDLVPSIIGWTSRYVDTKLLPWMQDHQNWDGFMEFFEENGKVRARETVSSIMSSACRFAVFGAGLAALACLLRRIQKDGFMDFFDRNQAAERAQESLSKFVRTACGYAVVGAGIAALGMFLRR
ncbi:LOW QUALITY PROTEIN: anti-apoptotic protein NR13-like [Lytechinus variegatus]|uniref:LOW QUALITY PROTEIN: anti-apoptotic protein NR13-like n=1 Tax=Lytechinus variegatus TaxID=7654 RepID=UPI001BB2CEF4|nr:LOW QUALITY PROTEIN: anti-apoptotic protein NR13-like [Lytechinus variegatus]